MTILEKASQIIIEHLNEINLQKDSGNLFENLIEEFLNLILLNISSDIVLKNKVNNILSIIQTQSPLKNFHLTNIRFIFLNCVKKFNKSPEYFNQNIEFIIKEIKIVLINYIKNFKEVI